MTSTPEKFVVTVLPSYDDFLWKTSQPAEASKPRSRWQRDAPDNNDKEDAVTSGVVHAASSSSVSLANAASMPRREALADCFSWPFQPLLQHPMLFRIARSNIHRVMLVCYLVAWYVVVSALKIGNIPIAVIATAFALEFAAVALSRIDYTLLLALSDQFESWYLSVSTLVFCSFGIWSMADAFSVSYLVAYFGCIFVAAAFIILYDSEVHASFPSKLGVLLCGIATAIQVWTEDHFITPKLASVSFCFLFCTDSARMALVAITQIAMYYGKYFFKIVYARLHASRVRRYSQPGTAPRVYKPFVTLKLPVMVSVQRIVRRPTSTLDSMTSPAETATEQPSNARVNEGVMLNDTFRSTRALIDDPDAIKVVRIEAIPPREYFAWAPSFASHAEAPSSRTAARVQAPPLPIVRLFRYKAVMNLPGVVRLANSKVYQGVLMIFVGLIIVSISFPEFRNNGWIALVYLPVPFIMCLEMTRFDRTLFLTLFHRFEYWVVSASVMQALIFGFWAARDSFHIAVLIAHCIGTAVLFSFVASFDASVSCPTWLKFASLICAVADALTWMLWTTLGDRPALDDRRICVWFCADIRVLAQFGFLNLVIFHIKYTVALIRHPNRCAIIAVPLQYSFSAQSDALPEFSSSASPYGAEMTLPPTMLIPAHGANGAASNGTL